MHATPLVLTSKPGDTRTFSIPLRWGNRPFVPGSDWYLVFTAKSDPEMDDDDAEVEIELDDGLTVAGNRAILEVLDTHTNPLRAAVIASGDKQLLLYWDIQAERLDSDEVRTVASGTWVLRLDVRHGRRTTPGSTPSDSYLTPDGDYYVTPDGEEYYAQP
jgi:hypothetical protein